MSAPKHVMGLLQCLPLEPMILEQLAVMPMDVHVYVKLVQGMTELVTLSITMATICTDLVHLVSFIIFSNKGRRAVPSQAGGSGEDVQHGQRFKC